MAAAATWPWVPLAGMDVPWGLAAVVGFVESVAGVVLVLDPRPHEFAPSAALLFAGFALVLSGLGPGEQCGCFGPLFNGAVALYYVDFSLAALLIVVHLATERRVGRWTLTLPVVLVLGLAAMAGGEQTRGRVQVDVASLAGRSLTELAVKTNHQLDGSGLFWLVNSDCWQCLWEAHARWENGSGARDRVIVLDVGRRPDRVKRLFGEQASVIGLRVDVPVDELPVALVVRDGRVIAIQRFAQ